MKKDTVRVVKNPDAADDGIRYYRPKPYLLVTAADPTGRLVNMKIEYHPDFSEEYSIHPKGPKTAIALKEGWNLVGVNSPAPPPEAAPPPPQQPAVPEMVVAASNVPLGYYESVIGTANGQKYMQGWRYIGFSITGKPGVNPTFPPAGTNPNCPPPVPNSDISNQPLYGLVFFNGVQTFRQVNEIGANQLCPTFIPPYTKPCPTPCPPTTAAGEGPAQTQTGGNFQDGSQKNQKGGAFDPGDNPSTKPKETVPKPPAPGGGASTVKPKDDVSALLLNLPPLPRP